MERYMGGLDIIEAEYTEPFELRVGKDAVVTKPPGYLIKKPDSDVINYMPKGLFEAMFIKLKENPELDSGLSVSQEMVDSFIKQTFVEKKGDKTTLVRAVLINDFEICATSSCADPFNYKEEIGYSECMKKIKDAIWDYLEFLLCTAINGFGSTE